MTKPRKPTPEDIAKIHQVIEGFTHDASSCPACIAKASERPDRPEAPRRESVI